MTRELWVKENNKVIVEQTMIEPDVVGVVVVGDIGYKFTNTYPLSTLGVVELCLILNGYQCRGPMLEIEDIMRKE